MEKSTQSSIWNCSRWLFKDLRIKSLNELIKIGFDGYAMGGLAVGESQNEMFNVLDDLKNIFQMKNLIILMGVGTPSDILVL